MSHRHTSREIRSEYAANLDMKPAPRHRLVSASRRSGPDLSSLALFVVAVLCMAVIFYCAATGALVPLSR